MKELTEAINTVLVNFYGQENVFFGFARKATTPYQEFSMQGSGPSEYGTCNQGDGSNTGVMATYSFIIKTFSSTSTGALSRIEEIINEFEQTEVVMLKDRLIQTNVISRDVSEDPDQENTGHSVWVGTAIIEFTVSKGD